jgi:citrate synthase
MYWNDDATYGAIIGAAGALVSLVVVLFALDWLAGWVTGAHVARRRQQAIERQAQRPCIQHENQKHWSKYT